MPGGESAVWEKKKEREKEICDECVIKENRSCEGEFV